MPPLPTHLPIRAQGTYEECSANESFARLLREHNSQGEVAEEEPAAAEGTPGGKPPRVPVARADTKVIQSRAEADALSAAPGALGRAAVQDAQLARAPTFLPTSRAAQGSPNEAAAAGELGGDKEKYGKQLARFETMLNVAKLEDAKKGKGKDKKAAAELAKGALMVKEDREEGQVTGRVYWLYLCAYSVVAFFT